jgi:hypothetical protein
MRDEAKKDLARTGKKLGRPDAMLKCIAAARACDVMVTTREAAAAYKSLTQDLKRSRGKPRAQ